MDPDTVMLRARRRDHLDALLTRYAAVLGQPLPAIISSNVSDYPVRALLPRVVFAELLKQIALDISYGNFKAGVTETHGTGSRYVRVLHRVWADALDLEEPREGRRGSSAL